MLPIKNLIFKDKTFFFSFDGVEYVLKNASQLPSPSNHKLTSASSTQENDLFKLIGTGDFMTGFTSLNKGVRAVILKRTSDETHYTLSTATFQECFEGI